MEKVVPQKTDEEQKLFEKWKGWIASEHIPKNKIKEYKKDVKKLKIKK